jgi:hypothetical protein
MKMHLINIVLFYKYQSNEWKINFLQITKNHFFDQNRIITFRLLLLSVSNTSFKNYYFLFADYG